MYANEVIEGLLFRLGVSLGWFGLSALGLVVLGIAPATCAAANVLSARSREENPRLFRDMWRAYRSQFASANLRLLPFLAIQITAAGSMYLALWSATDHRFMSTVMGMVAALAGAWATMSAMALVASPRLRRQDWLVSARLALLMPGALPLRSIATLLGTSLWSFLTVVIPPLGVVLGPAVAIGIALFFLGGPVASILELIDSAAVEEH